MFLKYTFREEKLCYILFTNDQFYQFFTGIIIETDFKFVIVNLGLKCLDVFGY